MHIILSRLARARLLQAQEIAQQLEQEKIDYAFTSHLLQAERTLEIVLKPHLNVPVFVDDRLIERRYGTLQGKSKIEIAAEKPEWFAKVHRGYDFAPPEGESLKMVESRTLPFIVQLERWLQQNSGNVAISCHGNSMRPIRKVFEHLALSRCFSLRIHRTKRWSMLFTYTASKLTKLRNADSKRIGTTLSSRCL